MSITAPEGPSSWTRYVAPWQAAATFANRTVSDRYAPELKVPVKETAIT